MNLNIGTIKLPINAATKTFALLGKRGAGKTYNGGVLAEEFYKVGVPFVVFDPIDVWWGLRLNKNGKDSGLPIVVFGLEHADIPLTKDMGRDIARAIVHENISCVISTFGMPKVQQRHLIAEFSEELLNINNTPRHVFIEEAHEFVPQRVMGAMGKVFAAVEALVVMGRNRGIGVTLLNQRAATVNKDVLTQIDTLLAFRNVAPQDRKALREWVEHHSAEGDFEKFMDSLPSLPTGEGWVWSPEFMGVFERVKIRQRETFHPDREKLGDKFEMPVLNQSDVQSFIQKFKTQPKQSEGIQSKEKDVKNKVDKPHNDSEIKRLTNVYESQLIQKDMELSRAYSEIDRLKGVLSKVAELVGGKMPQITHNTAVGEGVKRGLDMWISKVGTNTAPAKILAYLAEKQGLKLNHSQVRTGVGISAKSSGYGKAMALLRANNLVVEHDGKVWINPEI